MLTLTRKFLEADLRSWKFRSSDFLLAAASVAVGLYFGSGLWIGAGIAAFALALVNPAYRLQRWLNGFVRRKAGAGAEAGR